MGHAAETHEGFEVIGDERRAVVTDDSWLGFRVSLLSQLKDGFDIDLFHLRSNIPMDNQPRVAVKNGCAEVKSTTDIQVRHIDMPMLVSLQGLIETSPFPTRLFGESPIYRSQGVDAGVSLGCQVPIG